MVNPEIIARCGSAVMREGCMSVPDYTGDVERATAITVRFLDGESGTPREVAASGFEAVAIQHEMDHLDGVLFLDRVVSISTGLFRRKNYAEQEATMTAKEKSALLDLARDHHHCHGQGAAIAGGGQADQRDGEPVGLFCDHQAAGTTAGLHRQLSSPTGPSG